MLRNITCLKSIHLVHGDNFEGGTIVMKIISSAPKINVFSHSYSKY